MLIADPDTGLRKTTRADTDAAITKTAIPPIRSTKWCPPCAKMAGNIRTLTTRKGGNSPLTQNVNYTAMQAMTV